MDQFGFRDLLQRCVEKDQLACAQFWLNVHPMAAGWVRNHCGGLTWTRRADLAVSITGEALLSLPGFDPKSESFPWLAGIARRLVFDQVKDEASWHRLSTAAAIHFDAAETDPALDGARVILRVCLRSALRKCRRKLTRGQARVLFLRLLRGMNNIETGAKTGQTPDAVSKTFGRGLKMARAFLLTFPEIREHVGALEARFA